MIRAALALTLTLVACAEPPVAAPPPAPAPEVGSAEEPPEPEPEPEPERRAVTIGVGGDVLIHRKVTRSASEQEGGFRHVLGGLRSVIGEDEIALANLETPLSLRIDPETGEPPVLGAPAEVADGLAFAGVDAVSVANNHSYDQQAGGLGDTLGALAAAGVQAAGASTDAAAAPGPVRFERGGLRVAFLAFTERVNRGPVPDADPYTRVARYDEETSLAAITAARADTDLVVVSIHWSHDFVQRPLLTQRAKAAAMIEAGADLIFGHGPHVLQEVERHESSRGEALVAYSLGNLVSNQALRYFLGRSIPTPEQMHPAVVLPTLRDGAWLRVRFALEDERLHIESIEATALWTVNNYLEADRARVETGTMPPLSIRTVRLSEADEATRAERLGPITEALGPEVRVQP